MTKETYSESSGGNLLLKKPDDGIVKPVDCERVMIQKIRACPKMKIGAPEDVVKLMKESGGYDRERAFVISLDTKNNVIGVENISVGSLNASIVHPREAVKGSLLLNAANVIFVHNHPSGDPAPSREDIDVDTKLKAAFNTVGISLLDSIILGQDKYYSFKEHGMFDVFKGESQIMEREEVDETCSVAIEAALSVFMKHCGSGESGEEQDIDMLEKEAMRLVGKVKSEQRETYEAQVRYFKENGDVGGLLRVIGFLKNVLEPPLTRRM